MTTTTDDKKPIDLLYTVKETCQALHISRTTLYELFDLGKLDKVKILRNTYAKVNQVKQIAEHGTDGQSAA